ncbi:signal peptidase II [Hyphococcus sp.]|uniref:signal peptidase II n=1 Tax=Hyphococcus sp. TaxID=2038636 RepID=UPI002080777B|nr:MAG: lipoprotein signal peptidase [Marinicaulis sp.]
MTDEPSKSSDVTIIRPLRPAAVIFGLATAVAVFTLDFVIKQQITAILANIGGPIEITQFFSLVLGFNRGVSFGLFSSDRAWAPWVLSAVAVAIAAWLALRLTKTVRIAEAMGLGLIIGGALANSVDRIADGSVTDYLDFYIGDLHWPAFNLADAAIVCGVAMFAYFMAGARSKPSCF